MSCDRTASGRPASCASCSKPSWSVNPNLPLGNVRTLDEIQADSMAADVVRDGHAGHRGERRTAARRWSAVYGVIAVHRCRSGRAEIGIRMALGAQTGDVRAAVPPAWARADVRRHRAGHWRCHPDDTRHVGVTVRRWSDGPRHLRGGVGGAGRRRGPGDVSSRPPRLGHRPGCRLAFGHLRTI